jgi:hypothetical protein
MNCDEELFFRRPNEESAMISIEWHSKSFATLCQLVKQL